MKLDGGHVTSILYIVTWVAHAVGKVASPLHNNNGGDAPDVPSLMSHVRHVMTTPMTSPDVGTDADYDVDMDEYLSDGFMGDEGEQDDETTSSPPQRKGPKKGGPKGSKGPKGPKNTKGPRGPKKKKPGPKKKGRHQKKKKPKGKGPKKKKGPGPRGTTESMDLNEVEGMTTPTTDWRHLEEEDEDEDDVMPTSHYEGMTLPEGVTFAVFDGTKMIMPTGVPPGLYHYHPTLVHHAVGPVRTRNLSDEENLLQTLFSDYNPSARPVMNSSKTVMVSIQFSLMHLKDLNVISQVLTTTGLLIMEWTDERLTWTPSEHNNLTEIIIEAKGLWRPEFAVINGAEKIYEDYNQFRAVITSEGRVHWEPGGVFKTMCEIDITYYPFDEQRCELTFGAWSYHTSKMNLTNSSEAINLDSYKTNGEWEIYNTLAQRNEFFYECCPNERFANVAFVIYLRRRHTFYVMNVILPSIMTSVLLLSVFFCTPGQKVQIGVVVLLSFRIFLLNVAGNIPKTSDHIPLLGIYLTCTMAITTLSMVLTVFVLNLHHVSDRPVPGWAKRLVFVYIARMLGMCSVTEAHLREKRRSQSSQPRLNSLYRRPSATGEAEGDERTAIIELHSTRAANGTPETTTAKPHHHHHHGENASSTAFTFNKPKEEEKAEDHGKDWKRMAEVFDRLFFWLFLLAILVSTLVLFHPLTNSYMRNER